MKALVYLGDGKKGCLLYTSGAHLNPAVTLAFAVRRNFPWKRVPRYIAAQFAGGIAAACFLRLMFGNVG